MSIGGLVLLQFVWAVIQFIPAIYLVLSLRQRRRGWKFGLPTGRGTANMTAGVASREAIDEGERSGRP